DLFESTFAVSWVVAAEDADGAARVEKDAAAVLAALPPLLRKNLAYADNAASWFVHHGMVSGGAAARASWRVLFAQALLRWDEQQRGKTT
ncbi:MAG: molecular chaperone TorD, partial [Betaproteobacteria bacterium]|nr:molecular chaperone TorD [Betaproteobacteria bacterium]